jgi:hypothetical protein
MRNEALEPIGRNDVALITMMAFAAACLMATGPQSLVDGDTGWHIAAGRWILTHRSIPQVDPFSFTYAGHPWVAHEWLSELLMALAYMGAGWSGVLALFGCATGLLFLVVGLQLRRWLRPASAFAALGIALAALLPFMIARPHMLALPLLAIWVATMLRSREENRPPPLALAALMTVWANMHGSFVFGLALVAPFTAEAVLEAKGQRLRTALPWIGFGLASIAASLLTPHGVEGLVFPLKVTNMKVLARIAEWVPARFDKLTIFEPMFLYTLMICLVRGVRVPAIRLLILLAGLHMALQHVRQQAILAVLAPLLLSEPLGRAFEPSVQLPRPSLASCFAGRWREYSPAAAVLLTLFFGSLALRLYVPFQRPNDEAVPVTAVAHIPATLRKLPVFNEYSFGGLLIFNDIKPYIDGRADMYGDAFTLNTISILGGDKEKWSATVARYGIRWTILSPKTPLLPMVDQDPNWRRVYADKWAVIHEAVTPPRGPSAPHP